MQPPAASATALRSMTGCGVGTAADGDNGCRVELRVVNNRFFKFTFYLGRGWRGVYDFEAGARLLDWGVHTVDLCQWVKGADATGPVEYTPSDTGIVCRYADGVPLTLHFLAEPFKDRGPQFNTQLGTCPVRFVGREGP